MNERTNTQAPAALASQPAPVAVDDRPECFEFALDFLGEPEASKLRAYVETLEAALQSARSGQDGGAAGGEVVGYRVSLPDEPELGFWFSEEPNDANDGHLFEPLVLSIPQPTAVPATQAEVAGLTEQHPIRVAAYLRRVIAPQHPESNGIEKAAELIDAMHAAIAAKGAAVSAEGVPDSIRHLASVAIAECPSSQAVADWEEAALKVCAYIAAAPAATVQAGAERRGPCAFCHTDEVGFVCTRACEEADAPATVQGAGQAVGEDGK